MTARTKKGTGPKSRHLNHPFERQFPSTSHRQRHTAHAGRLATGRQGSLQILTNLKRTKQNRKPTTPHTQPLTKFLLEGEYDTGNNLLLLVQALSYLGTLAFAVGQN